MNSAWAMMGIVFSVALIVWILMLGIFEIQMWWMFLSPAKRALIKIFMLLLMIAGMIVRTIYILHLLR